MNLRKPGNYFINAKFQLIVIGLFAAISLAACAVLYGTVHFLFQGLIAKGVELGLPKGHVFFQFLDWQKGKFDVTFLLVAVGVFVAITVCGLILSHKIAGPLHRFATYLEEEKHRTDSAPLKFRDGDFFPEIPELFNDYQAAKLKSSSDRHEGKAS